jgi:hypothetical protein
MSRLVEDGYRTAFNSGTPETAVQHVRSVSAEQSIAQIQMGR